MRRPFPALLLALGLAGGCGKGAPDAAPATAAAADGPVRLKDGRPVATAKLGMVLASGSYVEDTPDGRFAHAPEVMLMAEGAMEWAYLIRPTRGQTIRVDYGKTDKSGGRVHLSADTPVGFLTEGQEVFPKVSYHVADRQGRKVGEWTAPE